jgi:hypothetical protein
VCNDGGNVRHGRWLVGRSEDPRPESFSGKLWGSGVGVASSPIRECLLVHAFTPRPFWRLEGDTAAKVVLLRW